MRVNKNTVLVLLLIMLIAAFFMLWHLTDTPPGLYPDEAMNGNNALEAIHTGQFKAFYGENNGREGLYINIVALSVKMFGNKPWAIRLVSAIFGIFTVLGLFLLARELFKNVRVALFSSFFLATSFWFINFSRIGFRAIMAPFFLVWGMYFLWTLFNEEKSETGRIVNAVLGGIFFGLGFHSYIAYRIAPALLLIPFLKGLHITSFRSWGKTLFNHREGPSACWWCLFGLFLIFTVVAAMPLGFYFINNPADFFGRTSQISVFSADNPMRELGMNVIKTAGMFWWSGDYNWRHNLSGAPQLLWPVGIFFAIGIINAVRRRKLEDYLLFLWIFIMLLPVVISAEGIPHALRAIVAIPPVMILSALGLDWIYRSIVAWIALQKSSHPESLAQLNRIEKGLFVLLIVFLLSIIISTYTAYFIKWGEDENTYNAFAGNYADIGRWLNTLPQDTQKYVIVNARGVDVRGVPMPAQTVMFLTDTFGVNGRQAKHISYLSSDEIDKINCQSSCAIVMLENDPKLSGYIKIKIPGLRLDTFPGFSALIK